MLMDPVPADNVERPNLPVPPESFHDSWRGLCSVIFHDPYSQREDDIGRTGCQPGSKAPEVMPADLSRIIQVPVQRQIVNARSELVALAHGRKSAALRRRGRACGGAHVDGAPGAAGPMQLV